MKLRVVPTTVKGAIRFVRAHHRHLPELRGGLFAAGVEVDGELVGVAVAGLPRARVWNGTGRISIARVAVAPEADNKNACSMLYGAICRAAQALGWVEAWTETLPDEPGASLRAAGFTDMGLSAGGEWSRPSRVRAAARHPEPKRRWMRRLG